MIDYQSIGTKGIYVVCRFLLENSGMNICAPGRLMSGVLWISV